VTEQEESSQINAESMTLQWMMKVLRERLDDDAKKQVFSRLLDERILTMECKAKVMECKAKVRQHRHETLQMIKQLLEK